jgi:phenylpropionate dioxygenase-like ring-hydroxylating dioxygenase large terminal subunit
MRQVPRRDRGYALLVVADLDDTLAAGANVCDH